MHPDISPDFIYSKLDQEIFEKIMPHEATPRAIRVFSNHHRQLSDYAYWFMLGTLWVSYSGWSELWLWRKLFLSERPKRDSSLMKPSELIAWRELPETLTVYRAHRPNEVDWLSYTLDPLIAARFATERGVPYIGEYTVPKNKCLALFLRRDEKEVICLDISAATLVRCIAVVIATAPPEIPLQPKLLPLSIDP